MNVCFKLALKQGFSALVTVISLIYSAVCDAGSCLDLQQPAVEPFLSSTGLLLVFLRGNADLASFARANQRSNRSLPASEQSAGRPAARHVWGPVRARKRSWD
eukprot:COSAG05_NODE_570_length_8623_cov_35.317339_8_plen_103_part_00